MISSHSRLAATVLAAIFLTPLFATLAIAQTAPVPRAVVSAAEAPEAMGEHFARLSPGDTPIAVPGAQWLQLHFAEFDLGEGGRLTITSADGESQSFTQTELEAWEGLSAIFNSAELIVTLTPGEPAPGEAAEITARVEEVIIGLTGRDAETGIEEAPDPLRDLLGGDIGRFVPEDAPRIPNGEVESPLEETFEIETICGPVDDRVPSGHALIGRIMPIGCTGWIINDGRILTAGHCISSSTKTLEFNVPTSKSNGTTVSPGVADQYKIITSSIVDSFSGVGNDWAVFEVEPNTQSGLMPMVAQGGAFTLSDTNNPPTIRITGYGVDSGSANQTQQTHAGALTENSTSGSNGTLRYTADSRGGNSGGPVIVENGGNLAIGIHTNGGCSSSGGSNAATSMRNDGLWAEVGGTADDLVWRNFNGQVHYWPMANGQRQGGINIHSPVSWNWRLEDVGDVDGDGTDDIVWRNLNGQTHYWPMQNGQRQGGINIHSPVSWDWHLGGVGDVDGDGTDDIVWRNRNGQVHYWPMLNGQRQGGINIHTPVNWRWTLAGVGDVNGDGTDDIVWRDFNGQVHYWPMQNGQRQGGINIHSPVDWVWKLEAVGDVNGDGTDDIIWQHRNGQTHYWPMLNGQRQGGINIHTPVDAGWKLSGVGNVD